MTCWPNGKASDYGVPFAHCFANYESMKTYCKEVDTSVFSYHYCLVTYHVS